MKTSSSKILWMTLAVAVVCVLCMNVFCIPGHDELFYAFKRLSPGSPRIASLWDILEQQHWDYCNYNARVLVHAIVTVFAAFRLYYLFDAINTAVWFLYIWIIFVEAKGRRPTLVEYLLTFSLGFVFLWYAEAVCMNAAFGVNYLWVGCATVAIMHLWRRVDSWWLAPMAFVYGWSHEGFSFPMIGALFSAAVVRSVATRKLSVSLKQLAFLGCMSAGAVCYLLGPAIRARAGETIPLSVVVVVKVVAHAIGSCILAVWPMVLLTCVCAVGLVLFLRKRVDFFDSLEWWLFLVYAFGLFVIASQNGILRLCVPWLLAALVLCLRHFGDCFPSLNRLLRDHWLWIVVPAFASLLCGTLLQISYGIENWKMVSRYCQSRDGVTFRKILPPLMFDGMCSYGIYSSHLCYFPTFYSQSVPVQILTEDLYVKLMDDPETFLGEAKKVDGTELYAHPAYRGLLFKPGEFTDAELVLVRKKGLRINGQSLYTLAAGKRAWYDLGRFDRILARPRCLVELTDGVCTVTSRQGKKISLANIEFAR